jgi:DNA-binding SARP family transcriptional activator
MSANGRITFEILGPVRAFDGAAELDLGASKQRAVLAMLLLNANKPVTPSAIIDGIWADDPPENGANVIQKYVAGLRRVLEPARSPRTSGGVITLTEAGYVLAVGEGCLDIDLFQQTVTRAQDWRSRGQLAAAAEMLRGADAMWRGEPLAGVSGPAIESARSQLTEHRTAARLIWAEIEMDLGHHSVLIPTLTEAIAQSPLREDLRYLHILALYRSGRQGEALASYDETRRLLAETFGIDPSESLQQLYRRILQADPTLYERAPAPVAVAQTPLPTVPVNARFIPVPPDPPMSSSMPTSTVVLGVVGIAIPLVSCGFGTWALMFFFAIYRRSRLVALSAVLYLALTGLAAYDVFGRPPASDGFTVVAIMSIIINFFGGAVQGALLGFGIPRAAPDPRAVAHITAKARRDAARDIVRADAHAASRLGIGRPHLPRQIDDGGLFDLNVVPPEVLIGAGLAPARAHAIILDRLYTGPLTSVNDLLTRGLVSQAELDRIREFAFVLPGLES